MENNKVRITFHYVKNLASELQSAREETSPKQENSLKMKAFIVEHIKKMMKEREKGDQVSNIQLYADNA